MNDGLLMLASIDDLSGWLWRVNWQAAVLATLVLLVVALVGRRLAPKWRYALWLLVVVRLCLPMLPSSSMSVFNLWPGGDGASADSNATAADRNELSVSVEYGAASGEAVERPAAIIREDSWIALHWRAAAIGLWLLGVVILVGFVLLAHRRLLRRIGAASDGVEDKALVELLNRCRDEMGVRGPIEIRLSDAIGSPALLGVRRPMILLPRDMLELDRDALRFVLLHELAHVKRRDVLMNWLLTGVAAAHWFNPLAHYVVSRCRQERELICDQMVLAVIGDVNGRAYGRALIDLFERLVGEPCPALAVGLFGRRSLISRRIDMISRTSSSRQRGSLVAVLLFAGIAGATLTDARVAPPEAQDRVLPGLEMVQDPAAQGDSVTVIYDVRDLLGKMQNAQPATRSVPVLSDIPILSYLFRTDAKYIVGEGDTLPSLAQVFYGDEQAASMIAERNNLPSGGSLRPGQELLLPSLEMNRGPSSAPNDLGAGAASTLMSTIRERLKMPGQPSSVRTMAIDPRRGTLVATMGPPAQQRLSALLSELRDTDKAMIEVQTRFITGLGSVKANGGVQLNLPGDEAAGRVSVVELTADQIEVISDSKSDGKVSVLASPRVLVSEGQDASVSMMSAAEIAVPDADGKGGTTNVTVNEGISVSVRVEVSDDRKTVMLHLHPSWSSLSRVKPLPVVQQAEASLAVSVSDGGAILLQLKGAALALVAAQRAANGEEALPILKRDNTAESEPLYILVTPRVILTEKAEFDVKPGVADR